MRGPVQLECLRGSAERLGEWVCLIDACRRGVGLLIRPALAEFSMRLLDREVRDGAEQRGNRDG